MNKSGLIDITTRSTNSNPEKSRCFSLMKLKLLFGICCFLLILCGAVSSSTAADSGRTKLHELAMSADVKYLDMVSVFTGDENSNWDIRDSDVNIKDNKGMTPLHYAALRGDREIIWRLLGLHLMNSRLQKPDLGAKDGMGNTPLHLAFLSRAAPKNKIESALLLIERGAKNLRNTAGDTPLHLAAWEASDSYNEVVELLIKNGANVNAKDSNGNSALHYAVYKDKRKLALFLIANKANVNLSDNDDITPLRAASENGVEEIAKILISKGANVNSKDVGHATPLHLAANGGFKGIVIALLENGAKVNAADVNGNTPLHAATARQHKNVANVLMQNGASAYAENSRGITPLDMAVRIGNRELLDSLKSN